MDTTSGIQMTRKQARQFLVSLHFSRSDSQNIPMKDRILQTVRALGCVQYDPLCVVGRNHDLVLNNRVAGYHPGDLERAMYEEEPRTMVEGIDKNLAIYPASDWPHMTRQRKQRFGHLGLRPEIEAVLPAVRQRLRRDGPLRPEDLEMDGKVNWPWGSARLSRAALEALWYGGEAILHHREGTRKFYSPADRLLPESVLAHDGMSADDYHDWHTLRRIRGIGLTRPMAGGAWLEIVDYSAAARNTAFARLAAQGKIVQVRIEGLQEQKPYHMAAEHLPVLERVLSGRLTEGTRFLAPLDNLIWDRRMVRELFDFDYTWEVYTPVVKRKYGYYVLPVLHDDGMVARFEAERHRPGGPLRIIGWWWEDGVRPSALKADMKNALERFAEYLGATDIDLVCDWNGKGKR